MLSIVMLIEDYFVVAYYNYRKTYVIGIIRVNIISMIHQNIVPT